jgi:hypothetical protein
MDCDHCDGQQRRQPDAFTGMAVDPINPLDKLLAFVQQLDRRRISRRLDIVRDAVMVEVYLPGARWEVEFFSDGHVEVEIFRSDGGVTSHAEAETALQRLLDEEDEAEAQSKQLTSEPRHLLGE